MNFQFGLASFWRLAFVQTRAIRRRRLARSFLSERNTPLAFVRSFSVPAETPGKTVPGTVEAFSPPKFSSYMESGTRLVMINELQESAGRDTSPVAALRPTVLK